MRKNLFSILLLSVTLLMANTVFAQVGIITNVAGNNVPGSPNGYSGDGGPGTGALLNSPHGTAVDASGNIYIVDASNGVIRMINTAGIITTVAGNFYSKGSYSGDGGPATLAGLSTPTGVAVDLYGNIYIADNSNQVIREVYYGDGGLITGGTIGYIYILAGNNTSGYNGDGIAATTAQLNEPTGVAVDQYGNIYIADLDNYVIREVYNADGGLITGGITGYIYTVAGMDDIQGNESSDGTYDGGPATGATGALLNIPVGVAADASGNVYIADQGDNVVRVVAQSNGNIYLFAGSYFPGYFGDGSAATSAQLLSPSGIAVDGLFNVYIGDNGNDAVREVNFSTGNISTIAGIETYDGNSSQGYSGDNGPATAAQLSGPYGVAVDGAYNIYIADNYNGVVREVDRSGNINTIAGNNPVGYNGDGGPGTSAEFKYPVAVAVDGSGNLYIADQGNNVVREVNASTGNITTIAGDYNLSNINNGELTEGNAQCASGCPPPTGTQFSSVSGIVVDAFGDTYIADGDNNLVWRVTTGGAISVFAGGGDNSCGTDAIGDGGPATCATLSSPSGLATDGVANLYIVDNGNLVVRVVNGGNINIVAGVVGTYGYNGDNQPATAAYLKNPSGVAVDQHGNIYIADSYNETIREVVSSSGYIYSIAGTTGSSGYTGDGFAATSAQLDYPHSVAVDGSGNVYIDDYFNSAIRMVNSSGIISTIAGNQIAGYGYSGNGGPATAAQLNYPSGIAVDGSGNVYIADIGNEVIRKVAGASFCSPPVVSFDSSSNPSSCSSSDGTLTLGGLTADSSYTFNYIENGAPNSASITADGFGNYTLTGLSDYDTLSNVYVQTGGGCYSDTLAGPYRLNYAGSEIITTVAGNYSSGAGYGGDGGPATAAQLNYPGGTVLDAAGNMYIADQNNNVIRKVNTAGIISTFAGNASSSGYIGDGGPATAALLNYPSELAIDKSGNIYFADQANDVIREINTAGIINTFAGNGNYGYAGDGSAAIAAELNTPDGIVVDGAGNVYFTDDYNNVIRKVDTAGIISTVAGNYLMGSGYSGDGGPATLAELNTPSGVSVDGSGNLYIADDANNVVRKVNTAGIISTFAGNNSLGSGYSGDGAAATAAELNYPSSVTVDGSGNLYIADQANLVIREVNIEGVISTYAGNYSSGAGYSGDDGPATAGQLNYPLSLTFDGSGNLYISDILNQVIREVSNASNIHFDTSTNPSACNGSDGTITINGLTASTGYTLYFTENSVASSSPITSDGSGNYTFTGLSVADTLSAIYAVQTLGCNTNTLTVRYYLNNPKITIGFDTSTNPSVCGGSDGFLTISGLAPDSAYTVYYTDNGNMQSRAITADSSGNDTIAGLSVTDTISNIYFQTDLGCFTDTLPGQYEFGNPPITGNNLLCLGVTTALLDVTSGGTWNSSNTAVATIDGTGNITGVTLGVDTITNTCGIATSYFVVSVNPIPSISISGALITDSTLTLSSSLLLDSIIWGNPPSGGTVAAYNAGWQVNATTVAGITGVFGTAADELAGPRGIFVDDSGNLYVADGDNNRVQKWARGATSGTTVAGQSDGAYGFGNDSEIYAPYGVFVDAAGNVYVSDFENVRVLEWAPGARSGIVVAGQTDVIGAEASELSEPYGVYVDGSGNIYVADAGNNRIQKWAPGADSGITVAGQSDRSGGVGANQLSAPVGIYVDGSGNIYIADGSNNRIQEWAPGATSGTTVAGQSDGTLGSGPDELYFPFGVYVDKYGNIFISDAGNNRIQEWAPGATSGITVAGVGGFGSGAGELSAPAGIYLDDSGNIYVGDDGNSRVQKFRDSITNTYIPPVAGYYTATVTTFNGCRAADTVIVNNPCSAPVVSFDSSSNPSSCGGSDGSLTLGGLTADSSYTFNYIENGAPNSSSITADGFGNYTISGLSDFDTLSSIYLQTAGCYSDTLVGPYRLNYTGSTIVTTIVGNYSSGSGFSGDGGPATVAQLSNPSGTVIDAAGNIYIADAGNEIIRKVNTAGIISTFAGTPTSSGYSGDNGPATAALFNYPSQLAIDKSGNIYISDQGNNVIREINTAGIINTFAGDGTGGYGGDGNPATLAQLNGPNGIVVDRAGNVYFTDDYNNVIRKVTTAGIISTVAGNYLAGSGYSGDGGLATAAELNEPSDVTVDGSGNLYIADQFNNVVRKVNTAGVISTYAGNNSLGYGYSGDGGPATAAQFDNPWRLTVDDLGNVYIADGVNNVVREVNIEGIISTIAGNGTGGYSGDGGSPTAAEFSYPLSLSIDGSGNLYISDYGNQVVRKISNAYNIHFDTSTNPSTCGGSDGTITINGLTPYTGYTLYFTENSVASSSSITSDGSGNYTFTGLSTADTLSAVYAVQTLGCNTNTLTGPYYLNSGEFSIGFDSSSNPSSCAASDGTLTLGGFAPGSTDTIFYTENGIMNSLVISDGGLGLFTFTGLSSMDTLSNVYMVSTTGCYSDTLAGPYDFTNPKLTLAFVSSINPSVCGGSDGSLTLGGLTADSVYTVYYANNGSQLSQSVTADISGNGTITTLSAPDTITTIYFQTSAGCYSDTLAGAYYLSNPASSTVLSFESSTNPSVCGGSDGTLVVGGLTPSGYYNNLFYTINGTTLSTTFYADTAGNFTFTNLSVADTYTNIYVQIAAGCYTDTLSGPYDFTNPSVPPIVIDSINNPSVCGGSNGTLVVGGLTPSGFYNNLFYTTNGTPLSTSFYADTAGNFTFTSISVADTYTNIYVQVAAGCNTDTLAGPYDFVNPPGLSIHFDTITNPSACGSSDGTLMVGGLANYGSYSIYYNLNGSVQTTGMIADGSGNYTLGGFSAADTISNVYFMESAACNTDTLAGSYNFTNPPMPAVTGIASMCAGNTVTLDNIMAGGTWSSANTGVATVSSVGVVSSVSAGSDTISYTISGSCMTTVVITVNALPELSLSGSLCGGSTLTLNSSLAEDNIVWANTGGTVQTNTASGKTNAITVAGQSDGTGGSGANELSGAIAVYVDDTGNVYVADYGNSRVQKWAPGATTGITVAGTGTAGGSASELYGAIGVYVDGSGNVYVTDQENSRIQEWAPGATSGITVAGGNGNGSAANQFNSPKDVFVDRHGNVYVADVSNNRIQEWAPGADSGITVAGQSDGTYGSAANQLFYPQSVYVDGSGNIYVADQLNNRIQEWAPGADSGITVASGGSFNLPSGIFLDGSGYMYISDQDDNLILKWLPGASAGTIVAGSGARGVAANELHYPSGVFVDGSGNIYVADNYNSRVQEFQDTIVNTYTPTYGGNYTVVATAFDGCSATDSFIVIPTALPVTGVNTLCLGNAGTLSDPAGGGGAWSSSNTGIATVSSAGAVVSVSAGIDTITYSITNTCGTTIASAVVTVNALPLLSVSGNLCSGDTLTLGSVPNADSIVWANTGGTVQTNNAGWKINAITVAGDSDGTYGDSASQLSYPTGVFVDGSGNIYVADQYNSRIQEWAPGADSGITVAGNGSYGSDAGELSHPTGVYVDGSGNIYVADQYNSRIQEWAPGADSGITVAGQSDGTYGTGASQLFYPAGVYVDGGGNIYVADQYNNRIQEWAPGATSGTTVAGNGTYGNAANQLAFPQGVYVDGSGNIYVADEGNSRIQQWAPGADSGITVAGQSDGTFGSGASQLAYPAGVYVDGSGNLYIADQNNSRIQEWAPGADSGTTVAGVESVSFGGSGAAQLSYPAGVYVDGSGNIYVADESNSRVQEFMDTIVHTYIPTSGGSYTAVATAFNGCRATDTFNVNNGPVLPVITGTTDVCTGSTTTLSDIATGGTWNASNGNATVSGGTVTGITAGIDTIIYSVINGCGTTSVAAIVTVNALPLLSLSGSLCPGNTDTLNSDLALDSIVWSKTGVMVQVNTLGYDATYGITVAGVDSVSGISDDELNEPYSVFVDDTGNLYVADRGNNRIQKWAPGATSGITVAGQNDGTYGSGASYLGYPSGVYVDKSGNVYVADENNSRIQKWAPGATSGITVAGQSDGTYGSGASDLEFPPSVYVDNSGNIYIADDGNARIQEWAPGATSGTTVAGQTGVSGGAANQLSYPAGVYVDNSGNVYVADGGNARIQEWAPGADSGITVAGQSDGTEGLAANELILPLGVYVDGNGNVFVADEFANRIQEWAPGADSGITVAGQIDGLRGSGPGQLYEPSGIYLDTSRNIYVADGSNNRVQKFKYTTSNTYTPTSSGSYTALAITFNGCVATDSFTVNPSPVVSAIAGDTVICAGGNTTLSDTAAGGAWSSSNTSVATVNTSGNVAGIIAGSDTVTYKITNSCGTDSAIQAFFVTPYDTWTGTTSHDWNVTTNWTCGSVPTYATSAIIPASVVNMPIVYSGEFAVDSFSIASGDTVTLNGTANLDVDGSMLNNGIVNGTGLLNLFGFTAKTLWGNGSVNNLFLNNSAGATVNPGDTLHLTGVFYLAHGTFTTNGGLTLVSNASGTASIGQITGGGISGNVNCQKYIATPGTDTNRRAYRFWAHPFSISIPLSQIEKWNDITGVGGAINGFTTTYTNNPSCMWYNTISGNGSAVSDPGWTWFTSTNGLGVNAFKPKEGINLFIRGRKGEGLTTCDSCYASEPVTITMTGPVNQGTIIDTMVLGDTSAYNQLGNPYPSPVDIGTVINNAKTASEITGSAFYVWNPYLARGGAFEVKTISATPYYLEAYSSFQVQTSANGNTLTFNESNKSDTANESLLREEDLYTSLFIYDANYNTWDKFYLSFNDAASDALDNYDAGKPNNLDLNFYSLSSDNKKLNIDVRPYVDNEIIPLGITTGYQQQYIIRVENIAVPAGGQLYLHDKYLKTYTALQQGTEYRFNINSDAATQGNNRFELGLGNIPNDENAAGLSMLVTPNPASADATVTYKTPGTDNAGIRVTDISGAVIMSIELGIKKNGTVSLNVANLASGVYMVELTSGDKKITQRLVKE